MSSGKSLKIAFGVLMTLFVVMIIFYFVLLPKTVGYIRTITSEDGPLLSEQMQNWINIHRNTQSVSLYAYLGDGVYELVLSDNRHLEQNLYLHTETAAKIIGASLEIAINDIDAVNDSDVSYNNDSYFILKEKPSNIKVFVNGELYDAKIEEGINQITQ